MVTIECHQDTGLLCLENEMDPPIVWNSLSYMFPRSYNKNQLVEDAQQNRVPKILMANSCSGY